MNGLLKADVLSMSFDIFKLQTKSKEKNYIKEHTKSTCFTSNSNLSSGLDCASYPGIPHFLNLHSSIQSLTRRKRFENVHIHIVRKPPHTHREAKRTVSSFYPNIPYYHRANGNFFMGHFFLDLRAQNEWNRRLR